jgi:hypothetical protein
MAGFDAGAVVEPLDWDFTKITKDPKDKGTVPEPTDRQIEAMFKDVAKLAKELSAKAGLNSGEATPEQLMIAMADLPDDVEIGFSDMLDGMSKIFGKLCKNQPSKTQLDKLPMRIRMRFFIWLAQELRPENFGSASMNPGQVIPIRRSLPGA